MKLRPKKRDESIRTFDFTKMRAHMAMILARVQEKGTVDLMDVLLDRHKKGALATLEADGHILRAGPPDENQVQPYRAARDDDERAQFRVIMREFNLSPKQQRISEERMPKPRLTP